MKPRVPQTYAEINRKTVVDPIGSVSPPVEQPASGPPDAVIREAVADALLAAALPEVGVEVERGRIILRGWVRDADRVARAMRVVGQAAPETEILNRMHIGTPE